MSSRVLALMTFLVRIGGGVFLLAGTIKIISSLDDFPYLALPDPIVSFLSNRQVLGIAGAVEIIVGISLLRELLSPSKAYMMCWMTGVIIWYRLSYAIVKPSEPCKCLGYAAAWLNISPYTADTISRYLLFYLIVASLASLTVVKCNYSLGNRVSTKAAKPYDRTLFKGN